MGWKLSKHPKSLAEEDVTPLSLNMFNGGAGEINEEEDDDEEEEESDLYVMQEEEEGCDDLVELNGFRDVQMSGGIDERRKR